MSWMMSRQKHPIVCHVWLLVCLTSASANGESYTSPDTIEGARTIDAAELIGLASRHQRPVIIDARMRSDRKLGYIPGSISLPDTETSCESLARVIADKADTVIFYCNGPGCRRSDTAVAIAADCGYSHIYWFRGGIEAWITNNYPVDK